MSSITQLFVLITCLIFCAAQEFADQYRDAANSPHFVQNYLLEQPTQQTAGKAASIKNGSHSEHNPGSHIHGFLNENEMMDQTRADYHNTQYAPPPSAQQHPYAPYSSPATPPRPPTYNPWTPSYHEPGQPLPGYGNALYHPASKLSLFNPPTASVGFGKPVDSKLAGKTGGVGGLVTSLLGGGGGGLQIDSIKDFFFNNVLKPMLVAKGNIKSLIAKLIVPVLVLVLINFEILVVVWWLWEECPKGVAPPPPAPLPPPPAAPPAYYPAYPKAAYNYY